MYLPPRLFDKYLNRFDELIIKGEEIQRNTRIERGDYYPSPFPQYIGGEPGSRTPDKFIIDEDAFRQWNINIDSLLDQILPSNSIHKGKINEGYYDQKFKLESRISILKAIKEDFKQGFLGDLTVKIESEIVADYMEQAEQLLIESTPGEYDHIPAAVLSGAVLEKALKTLCHKQNPPIPIIKKNGVPLTLHPLIEELKKADIFNELKATQLRAWAAIRNKAAHGDFEEFNRSDVENMINSIKGFLTEYMS
jgi:uncharacterized protein YutE (UPF0331/DUF86 family)